MSADCSRTPPLVISRLFCTLLHNLLGLTVLTADDVDTLLDTVHQLTAQVVDNVTAILLDIDGANTRGVVQLEVNRLGIVGGQRHRLEANVAVASQLDGQHSTVVLDAAIAHDTVDVAQVVRTEQLEVSLFSR